MAGGRLVLLILVTGCTGVILIPGGLHALCPIRCTCDESKLSVDCKEAALDVVPITLNPSIAELFLSQNHIKSISLSFNFYRKLRLLDLTGNALSHVGSGTFAYQRLLSVLLLSKNTISHLEGNSFSGLESLRILSLSENHLKEIRETAVFAPLKNLEELDLSGNELTTLSPESLNGLSNLRSLHLQGNRFRVVPSLALSRLSSLLRLDLSGNRLQARLQHNSFPVPTLVDLNLQSNAIESLAPGAVSESLRSLDLASNRLTEVPAEAFALLPNLENLSIGRNAIPVIGEKAFSGLKNLKSLVFRNDDSLNLIHMNAFSQNPLLESIRIDFCPKLRTIEAETFIYAKENLRRVSLRGNGIRHLHQSLFDWKQLQELDVRGNPFECSCQMFWFWDLIRDRVNSNGSNSFLVQDHLREIICQEPSSLRGHELASISQKEMNCEQEKRADAASAAAEDALAREMSPGLLIPVTIAAAVLAAATTGLMAFCLARHRRRRLAEVRLKEYFSHSIHNPNSTANMSEEENMVPASKKEAEVMPEYFYARIGSPFDSNTYETTRLYDSHYQELDPRPALITSLSDAASSSAHTIRKTSNATTSARYQQRNPSVHMNLMQSSVPLPVPPARQVNPYSSSIVIQHPIKLDANLYRL